MNKPQQLLIKHSILLQLETCSPGSLPLSTILQGVTFAGYPTSPAELEKELQYLSEKNLLSIHPQTISPTLFRYKLTATGRDYLEEQGLV